MQKPGREIRLFLILDFTKLVEYHLNYHYFGIMAVQIVVFCKVNRFVSAIKSTKKNS